MAKSTTKTASSQTVPVTSRISTMAKIPVQGPTVVEALASMISLSSGEGAIESTTQVSIRLRNDLLACIDAIAKLSNLPRATLMTRLIEAGLENLEDELPREMIAKIDHEYQELRKRTRG